MEKGWARWKTSCSMTWREKEGREKGGGRSYNDALSPSASRGFHERSVLIIVQLLCCTSGYGKWILME